MDHVQSVKYPKCLTGSRYGDWDVMEQVDDHRPGTYYECLCTLCGRIVNVNRMSLVKGRSKRCVTCARRKCSRNDDMIGKRFGSWEVLEFSGIRSKSYEYLCRCDCGVQKKLHGPALRGGLTKSCIACHNKRMAKQNVKHGRSKTAIYKVWSSMKNRCQDTESRGYRWYGARGVRVCDKWQTFDGFYDDMGPRPPECELDRIDPDGDYCPDNCRWVPKEVNLKNKRLKTPRA